MLWTCTGCQNPRGPPVTYSDKFCHSPQPQQLNDARENAHKTKSSVGCDADKRRSSQTSDDENNLRLMTNLQLKTSSLVAMFDDHVLDDVTISTCSGLRDTYFRSPCVVDIANYVTRRSRPTVTCGSSCRYGNETVNGMVRNHLDGASRDSRLTSCDDTFPFPVAKAASSVRRDDADVRRRGGKGMTDEEERGRVSESSGADSSIVYSDSITSADASKSIYVACTLPFIPMILLFVEAYITVASKSTLLRNANRCSTSD